MYHKQTDPFYNSGRWKRAAAERMRIDHGLCCDCVERFLDGGREKVRDATMVHHVIPRNERTDLELDIDNLRSLCDQCHNKRHPEKGRARGGAKRPPPRARIIKI
ncbi:MAG: HNH endonuclease [Clostridia bacterium]